MTYLNKNMSPEEALAHYGAKPPRSFTGKKRTIPMSDLDEFLPFIDLLTHFIDEDNALAHYGVKGMKWGVRKDRQSGELTGLGPDTITRRTKNGSTITLSKTPPGRLHKFIAKYSESYRKAYNNSAYFQIKDSDNKTIGEARIAKVSSDELNLVWLGIRKNQRGQGYATAVFSAAKEFGSKLDVKKITLEVPGNSPDAQHIYTKQGFKTVGETIGSKDDMWGGLTRMEYTIKDKVQHAKTVDEFLAHYGVKGMKWGVRKDRDRSNRSSRNKKIAVGAGVGILALGGIAAAAVLKDKRTAQTSVNALRKSSLELIKASERARAAANKSSSVSRTVSRTASGAIPMGPARTTQRGASAVKDISQAQWKKNVASFSKQLADDNNALFKQANRRNIERGLGPITRAAFDKV